MLLFFFENNLIIELIFKITLNIKFNTLNSKFLLRELIIFIITLNLKKKKFLFKIMRNMNKIIFILLFLQKIFFNHFKFLKNTKSKNFFQNIYIKLFDNKRLNF